MYKTGGIMYTVFRGGSFTVDFWRSGRNTLRFLYNNRQYPGAKVGSGRAVVGENEPAVGFWGAIRGVTTGTVGRGGGSDAQEGRRHETRGLGPEGSFIILFNFFKLFLGA